MKELREENARLRAQLPERMKDCTILFKECPVGHGWLTATNWVQHGCPTCAIEDARLEATRIAPVGLPLPPSKSVVVTAAYLAKVVHEDMGTQNGRTALYWNLISVIQAHSK